MHCQRPLSISHLKEDIRDIPYIDHKDVIGLNFIRTGGPFIFRRHFRQGLRSHILEVLPTAELLREKDGEWINGLRRFPKTKPHRMLRIFRTRLTCLEEALAEIARVKLTESFLSPDFVARSCEMVVDYKGPKGRDLLLCGLQEYVYGTVVDPWSILGAAGFTRVLYDDLPPLAATPAMTRDHWLGTVIQNGSMFIARIKKMILHKNHIPDLAGVGNILITHAGRIKLVDINNISPVHFDGRIWLDDRGYPVCDKSVEALALLEVKLLGRCIDESEPVYRHFLDAGRKKEVDAIEKTINQNSWS